MDPAAADWTRVDDYLADLLVGHDPELEAVFVAQEREGLPAIEVAPVAGKLLNLLVRMCGARRVLEIGTLGGYSTIWLARGLPAGGEVVTIEAEPHIAAIARADVDAAGVGDRVRILEGRGEHVLPTLAAPIADGTAAPFDLVFVDADKESTELYLDWAARLGRVGTVVVVDNVVRDGAVADPEHTHPQIEGIRRGLRMLRDDPRFDATALQTVGVKGWDGLAIALVVTGS